MDYIQDKVDFLEDEELYKFKTGVPILTWGKSLYIVGISKQGYLLRDRPTFGGKTFYLIPLDSPLGEYEKGQIVNKLVNREYSRIPDTDLKLRSYEYYRI